MSYHVIDDCGNDLGFSLKPPKWLRKAQPGKAIAKAATATAGALTRAFQGKGGIGSKILFGLNPQAGATAAAAISSGGQLASISKLAQPINRAETLMPMATADTGPVPYIPSQPSAPQPTAGNAPTGTGSVSPVMIGAGLLFLFAVMHR